jgi:RNA polymerase sigma factor (TIGR02999 family)
VYLRLAGDDGGAGGDWQNRAHFFGAAARSMRRILVDHARAKTAKKRGGKGASTLLDTTVMVEPRSVDVIAVDDALEKLGALDPEQARVVELRFFTGLTEEETAEALGISTRTVHRKWLSAKAYLHRELAGGSS